LKEVLGRICALETQERDQATHPETIEQRSRVPERER
jgi:hypothetical protein